MATATALKPTQKLITETATIELVQATASDLKTYDGFKKQEILRIGMIYWLKSGVTEQIEQTPYILTPSTNIKELKEFLDCKQVYIARHPFND